MSPLPDLDPATAAAAARACACLNLRRAARTVTRFYDEALAPSGLRSTQFAMLTLIRAQGPVALPALAAEMGLERSALTRRLAPLTREGWVKVQASRAAGPSHVDLTAQGLAKIRGAAPLWQRAQAALTEHLGPTGWDGLLAGLTRVSALRLRP